MGTNFYTERSPKCAHCGGGGEELHIGKSSIGWRFLFAAHPDLGLTSWSAWQDFLAGRVIKDEYGVRVSLADLKKRVEAKQNEPRASGEPDAQGYHFLGGEFS